MNTVSISKTAPNTQKYPLHCHRQWEIMYYLEGEGYLATEKKNYPFSVGSILIVPPYVMHGSVSEASFVNISVGCDFEGLFLHEDVITVQDNTDFDGRQLASLIYKNRHQSGHYMASLCAAYAQFILQNLTYENNIHRAIREIMDGICASFADTELDVTELLRQSGYAEDYIRSEFKKQTGRSPVDFLAKVRIDYAQKLLDIYGEKLPVSRIAEACGFRDPIYFSRRFKQFVGVSPANYRTASLRTP